MKTLREMLINAILVLIIVIGMYFLVVEIQRNREVAMQPQVIVAQPQPVVQQQPQVQPVIAQPVFTENGYDYAWMPRGINERGEHIADSGVKVPIGMTVAGPAIIKIASGTAVIVYNNQLYTITNDESIVWKYIGDDDFLTANTQFFPKERLIKIDGGLIREPLPIN